eukprot:5153085-Amphidinium_carterae.2
MTSPLPFIALATPSNIDHRLQMHRRAANLVACIGCRERASAFLNWNCVSEPNSLQATKQDHTHKPQALECDDSPMNERQ